MLQLTVKDIIDETDKVRTLVLASQTGATLPSYSPGAHIVFELGGIGTRSYSLIEWALDDVPPTSYRIAVQREDDGGGGSKAMHALNVGQEISAHPPQNDFELEDSAGPIMLLGGGIGVTPLISMATALLAVGRAFEFHYAARSQKLMGFQTALTDAFPEQMKFYFDDETPLNLAELMAKQPAEVMIYICGPKGMINAARDAASAAGLPDKNIRVELFSAPQTQSSDVPFEVEIQTTGEVFVIPADKTIIDVLEDAGQDIMYDCRRGDCGICQTDVISGVPDHRDVVLSEDERAAGNIMQICVSRAKTPRLVLDL